MRKSRITALLALGALGAAGAAMAAETITYRYDARGRLIRVERAGNVNNGVNTSYSHDKAGNRTNKVVSTAPVGGGTITTAPDTLTVSACGPGILYHGTVDVVANDSGGTGPLSVTAVSTATLGTAYGYGPLVYYNPDNTPGQEVLSYTVGDGNGATGTGQLTVTVSGAGC